MNPAHAIGDPDELAALYVVGAMDRAQRDAFEAHLAGGCERCAREVAALSEAAEQLAADARPVDPDPKIRAALMARVSRVEAPSSPQVWREWSNDAPGSSLFIRRRDEGEWEESGVAGVRVRRLFVDRPRNQITMMVRMDPGTSYPRHVHHGPEECYVLEGDLSVGDETLSAGDYQFAPVESLHGVQSTRGGCTLLIVSSLSDEIL